MPSALEMTEKVFTAQALSKTYASGDVEVHALRGVDLDIWTGEVVVLLGPSGSGKSTLLNIMGGLDHPTRGSLFFRGRELSGLDDRGLTAYRRQHVGFILVMFGFLLQWPTVLTLAMFPVLVVMYVKLAKTEEREAMREFGEAYARYAAEVPGFIPRVGRVFGGPQTNSYGHPR